MNIRLITFLFILLFNSVVSAQFSVKNNGDKKVQIVLARSSVLGWETIGWFAIEPGATVAPINKPLSDGSYYYYGNVIGCDGEYAGDTPFLIHPTEAFTIFNAEKEATYQAHPEYTIKNFRKVEVTGQPQYTLSLTEGNCSAGGKKVGKWKTYYDRDWEITHNINDASYYREVNYENGVPVGYVRDYYMSGKLQWDGKLKTDEPELYHGTCIWYYESGAKMKECVFDNGELVQDPIEWNADGTVKKYSYQFQTAFAKTERGVSSEMNKYAQRSRAVIQVDLPYNTDYYIYQINIRANQDAQQQRQSLIESLGAIAPGPATSVATAFASYLNVNTADQKLKYYVTDEHNSIEFMNLQDATPIPSWYNGENVISETKIGNKNSHNKIFFCVDNNNYLDGIVVTLEVTAVIKKGE